MDMAQYRFKTKTRLPTRYRCPEPLAQFADQYRAGAETSEAQTPDDLSGSLTVLALPAQASLTATLDMLITTALSDGTSRSDIAILSLAGQTQSALCKLTSLGEHVVRRGDDDDAAEHIICDTFLRYKGLERPLIIVAELDKAKVHSD